MREQKETIKGKLLKPSTFLVILLVFSLISLLSVIPLNLNMRSYGLSYYLVPAASSMLCGFLPLLIAFPFFILIKQKFSESNYRYRFLERKSYTNIFLITLVSVSFILCIAFSFPHTYGMLIPVIFCNLSISLSFVTSISTMIVLESTYTDENYVKTKKKKYTNYLLYSTLALIILSTIIQFIVFINFFIFGILVPLFLSLFLYFMIIFLRKERTKSDSKSSHKNRTFYVLILKAVFLLFTAFYCIILVLYIFVLTRGYLIINFNEFYAGFYLAIQGSYTLFLIVFYTITYFTLLRNKL